MIIYGMYQCIILWTVFFSTQPITAPPCPCQCHELQVFLTAGRVKNALGLNSNKIQYYRTFRQACEEVWAFSLVLKNVTAGKKKVENYIFIVWLTVLSCATLFLCLAEVGRRNQLWILYLQKVTYDSCILCLHTFVWKHNGNRVILALFESILKNPFLKS